MDFGGRNGGFTMGFTSNPWPPMGIHGQNHDFFRWQNQLLRMDGDTLTGFEDSAAPCPSVPSVQSAGAIRTRRITGGIHKVRFDNFRKRHLAAGGWGWFRGVLVTSTYTGDILGHQNGQENAVQESTMILHVFNCV